MDASAELEAFVDESLRIFSEHNYPPKIFIDMRERLGTVGAISRLVVSREIQSGFKRLSELGLLDRSMEAAVTRFPDEFSREVREAAEWRLSQVRARRD